MPNTASVSQQRPMNCRFDDILTFIRVESGSVTAAATRLNVSKSVISKRIGDLESALRVSSVIAHAWCAAAPLCDKLRPAGKRGRFGRARLHRLYARSHQAALPLVDGGVGQITYLATLA